MIGARRLLEGECAAFAAKAASAAQLRAIRKAHAGLSGESRRHHNPLDADRMFHVRIAEASGNSALVLVVQTLWDQRMGPLFHALESKAEYPMMAADTTDEHQAIITATLARSPAPPGGRGAAATTTPQEPQQGPEEGGGETGRGRLDWGAQTTRPNPGGLARPGGRGRSEAQG